jgi:radical SAM family uncharacterized protein/radical SAM-linked protein
VIGGGPCTVNPEPLAPFFDAFVVGDGEEVADEIVALALEAKSGGWVKERLLEGLARLQGVYVPSLFDVEYEAHSHSARIRSSLPGYERVSRRVAADLDPLAYPLDGIVPFTQVVHDRISLEIARGCTRGCRFCQAGFTYRPVRERSLDRILELARGALRGTGYEEISLLSLSSGDYSCISDLIRDLMVRYAPEKVAISLPSLRIGSLSDEIMETIKEVRKTGLTVAPEAGSERLRRVINKDVGEDEVLETARRVFHQGWLSLKLYFMIGLPTETQEDLEGIVALCDRILRETGARRARKGLNVSASTFVPKPHTPFQWATQLPLAQTHSRLDWLRRQLRQRGIHVKWQEPRLSLLEGAFSRGDRRLARVLMRAHELGCHFDGWSDQLRFRAWEQAFDDCGIPLEPYVTRDWSTGQTLPWEHIDIGVSRAYLLEEFHRAMAGQRTPDCRGGQCQGCAVCDQERVSMVLAGPDPERSPFPGMNAFRGAYHRSKDREAARKLRVRYTKRGLARLLSHLELNSVIIRALRRGEIPLRFSQGFHPMPVVDFGPALPVGVESLEECFDFESFGYLEAAEVLEILRREFPQGLEPVGCEEIPMDSPSLFREPTRIHYRIRIPEDLGPRGTELETRLQELCRMPAWMVRRPQKDKFRELDVKPQVEAVDLVDSDTLQLKLLSTPEGGVRLLEVLGFLLGLQLEEVRRLAITKTQVELLSAGVTPPAA